MKFSIRDVLLATVIAALALGWWIDRTGRDTSPPAPAPAHEYRLISSGKNDDKLFLYNTQTGAVWERMGNGKWSPHTMSLPDSKKLP